MAFDGNGQYNPPAPDYPAIPGTTIAAEQFNTIIQDIADALSQTLLRTGEAPVTGTVDFAGNKILRAVLDETTVGKTLPPGTVSDQLATMRALSEASFASSLPEQAGNAGKFITTNGTVARWSSIFKNITLQSVWQSLISADSSTSYTLDIASANAFSLLLNADTSISFGNFGSGERTDFFRFSLTVKQDATGGRKVAWPGSVSWLYSPPELNSNPGGVDTFEFFTVTSGTAWVGLHTTPGSFVRNYGNQDVYGDKRFRDTVTLDKPVTVPEITTDLLTVGQLTAQVLYAPTLNGGPMSGMRNRLLNADFSVDEINFGNAVTPSSLFGEYVMNQWLAYSNVAAPLFTYQRVTDAPPGAGYAMKISVATQRAPGADDAHYLCQRVEGLNVKDLAFGGAGSQFVTLSGMVKGSVAGKYAVSLSNGTVGRSVVGLMEVTTSWAPMKIVFGGDVIGTWDKGTGCGLELRFNLGGGSNFVAPAVGEWFSAKYTTLAGTVQLSAQPVGAALYIAMPQLERGAIATPFEPVEAGENLRRCLRYRELLGMPGSGDLFLAGIATAASQGVSITFPYKVTKRITPLVTTGGTWSTTNTQQTSPLPVEKSVFATRLTISAAAAGQFNACNYGVGATVLVSCPL